MHALRGLLLSLLTALVAASTLVASPVRAQDAGAVPHYDHLFVIVEENHGFTDVIGNPAAPNLNALANQFGLATDYFGISHPSEPNYVALLGGSTFGVNSDNAYYTNAVSQPSLIQQLDKANISWKAYLQGLPHPGYQGICYPLKCNGSPDSDPLYVSKHDAIQNFTASLNTADWNRQVPVDQLDRDLSSGHVPSFGYLIPTECSDQHGDPPFCIDSGNPDGGNLSAADPQDQRLVAQGDAYLGKTVSQITNASFWAKGNNAIVVAYDEGNDNAGCCDAGNSDPNGTGGGHVATVVVTSHGPRHVTYPVPSNHYSLLATIQDSFGLGCLQFTCDTGKVKPLSPLLTVTGAPAVATTTITPPNDATPTPTPLEPQSSTTSTATSGGWSVVPSPLLGKNNNSLGAIAGSSPSDIWAVGNFLPDVAGSNQDATLSLTEHYNGTTWTAVPSPNGGPNFNTLFGVAATGGKAWAVGVDMNAQYRAQALIESWDGTGWNIMSAPQPGSMRNLLYGAAAVSTSDVWAVGDQQASDGTFGTLVEHWDGHTRSVVPSPNPGSSGNHLYGVAAAGPDDVWAVGQQLGATSPDQPLAEHWDGHAWSVVATPALPAGTNALYSVGAGPAGVFAAGESDDDVTGAHPLVEQFKGGSGNLVSLPPAGSTWTNLWGITVAGNDVWAAGTFLDPATGNQDSLVLRGQGSTWTVSNAPNPGSGSNLLAGVATVGNQVWATGMEDQGGPHLTLLMHHNA
ncbi:MAG TPA: alkaline phosphatase family protein [Actinomycetota bacterium]|nr:alkaline phosphatase family protein [Actinomycetota bacterium]